MQRAGSQSFFSAPHPLCEQKQSCRQKPGHRHKNNGGIKMHVNWSPSTQRPDKQRYDNCFQSKIVSFVASYWHDVNTVVRKSRTRWDAYRTNILRWPPQRTKKDAYSVIIFSWPPLRAKKCDYIVVILSWPPQRTKKDAYSVIILSWPPPRTT